MIKLFKKMPKLIRFIKKQIFLSIKSVIDFIIVLYIIFLYSDNKKPEDESVIVYTQAGKIHFPFGLLAILSFNHFMPTKLAYRIINDGTLNNFHEFLIKKTGLNIKIISRKEQDKILRKIAPFPSLKEYYLYGWSGIKFNTSLLYQPEKKSIVLDIDILTFSKPVEIIDWLNNPTPSHLFQQDYANFSAISTIEAAVILKAPIKHHKVNTGLLCFDPTQILKNVSLAKIDYFAEKIIQTANDRLFSHSPSLPPVHYTYPFIEQSLHWLITELCHGKPLPPKKYFYFPTHTRQNVEIINPTLIHFAGAEEKRYIHKYLAQSLVSKFIDRLKGYKAERPWYIYSPDYCPRCKHI